MPLKIALSYVMACWLVFTGSYIVVSYSLVDPTHPYLVSWLRKVLLAITVLFSGGGVLVEGVHKVKPMYTGFAFLYAGVFYAIGVGLVLMVSPPLEYADQNLAITVLAFFLLIQIVLQAWFVIKKLKDR